jgi:hypothetical protein
VNQYNNKAELNESSKDLIANVGKLRKLGRERRELS